MSNFSCPECGTVLLHGSKSCSCGWGRSGGFYRQGDTDPLDAERKAARERLEAVFTESCRRWLDDRGITRPEMSQAERKAALAAYRETLKSYMRRADSHPRDWAHVLKTRYLDGEVLLPIQVQLASEAMGETWKNGECNT